MLSKEAIYCDLPLEELLKLMDEYERLKSSDRPQAVKKPPTPKIVKFAKIRNETVIHMSSIMIYENKALMELLEEGKKTDIMIKTYSPS